MITGIQIYLTIVTTGVLQNGLFLQQFSVQYVGSGSSTKSGNPGYITGKPILFLTASKSNYISALNGINSQGACSLSTDSTNASISIPLLFQQNAQLVCTTTNSSYCQNSAILQQIDSIAYAGIFGNAQSIVTTVWKLPKNYS